MRRTIRGSSCATPPRRSEPSATPVAQIADVGPAIPTQPRHMVPRPSTYPKTPRDLTVSTRLGGGLSLVALCAMGLLFLTEFQQYVARLETTLELDDNEEEKLLISFNLSLPRLPCHVASVDVRDVLGTRLSSDDTRNIFKHKLDAAGRVGALVGGTVSFAPGGQKLARENYVPGPRQPTNQGRKLAAMAMVEDDGPAVNTGSVDDLSPEDFEAALGCTTW